MPRPKNVTIKQGTAVDFSVSEASPVVVAYRFWLQAPGSTTWKLFAEGTTADDKLDHFLVVDPIPSGSIFGYALAVGGSANEPWRAGLVIAQPDAPGMGGAWDDTGVLSSDGGGLGHQIVSGKVTLL